MTAPPLDAAAPVRAPLRLAHWGALR